MKVLLTGAFGNLGTSCILELANRDYEIRIFDIKSKTTKRRYKYYKKNPKLEVFWGDITDKRSITNALNGIDVVIHTAAIIPPASEKNEDLTKRVNIEGTKNLIEVVEGHTNVKQFIFASSVSVHGNQKPSNPPVKTTDPFKPTDNYTRTKVACEELLRQSKLQWTIVRFGAILAVETRGQAQGGLDEYTLQMLFGIPLEQKIEVIHSHDAGLALVNAINNSQAYNKVFFAGGGAELGCQLNQKEFIFETLQVMGIKNIPENLFKQPQTDEDWYYTHWMDTAKSQEVLQYQRKSYSEYLIESKPRKVNRVLFFFMGSIIKRILMNKSPYKH